MIMVTSYWFDARGGGTPYVMGDTYVPRFWPPFFTLAGSSTIFLGYFFSSTNTKTIFCGIKTTNSYRIRSFRPQVSFFPRSFWVQFSAASGTPPSFFGPKNTAPKFPLRVFGWGMEIWHVVQYRDWNIPGEIGQCHSQNTILSFIITCVFKLYSAFIEESRIL